MSRPRLLISAAMSLRPRRPHHLPSSHRRRRRSDLRTEREFTDFHHEPPERRAGRRMGLRALAAGTEAMRRFLTTLRGHLASGADHRVCFRTNAVTIAAQNVASSWPRNQEVLRSL